ncbi:MAG: hypothetical protein KDK40_02140, partial [Chlamydiia bacterium]|nr:hypothetical protein [Chlamydiia bacterium]
PIPIIEAIASENELANLFIERLQSDLEKGNSQSVIFLLPIAMKNERILNALSPELLDKMLCNELYHSICQMHLIEHFATGSFAENLLKSACKKKNTSTLLKFLLSHHTYAPAALNEARKSLKSAEEIKLIDSALKRPKISSTKFFDAIEKNCDQAFQLWTSHALQLRSDPKYSQNLPKFIAKLASKKQEQKLLKVLEVEFSHFQSQTKRVKILQEVFSIYSPQTDSEIAIWYQFYKKNLQRSQQHELIAIFLSQFAKGVDAPFWNEIIDGWNRLDHSQQFVKQLTSSLIEEGFAHLGRNEEEEGEESGLMITEFLSQISQKEPKTVLTFLNRSLSKGPCAFVDNLESFLLYSHGFLREESLSWTAFLDQLLAVVENTMREKMTVSLTKLFLLSMKLKRLSRSLDKNERVRLLEVILKIDATQQVSAKLSPDCLQGLLDSIIEDLDGQAVYSRLLKFSLFDLGAAILGRQ